VDEVVLSESTYNWWYCTKCRMEVLMEDEYHEGLHCDCHYEVESEDVASHLPPEWILATFMEKIVQR
jgi:hypothetical protein